MHRTTHDKYPATDRATGRALLIDTPGMRELQPWADESAVGQGRRGSGKASAIWFPALQQMVWRVVADSTGEYVLRLRAGEMIYGKTLHVSDGLARRSPVRRGARLIDEVLYPSEATLPDSAPLASIAVAYPERRIDVYGARVTWIDAYIVLSIVFALALKRPLAGHSR